MEGMHIAIIPARGGSKRIKRKNLIELKGKPLIWHTINAAKESGLFNEIIVSTDDREIKDVCLSCGIRVIDRPSEIAQDTSPVHLSLIHVLKVLEGEGKPPETVTLLQTTSPLRTADDLVNAMELFKTGKYDTVTSVSELSAPREWIFFLTSENILVPAFDESRKGILYRSQETTKAYGLNGAVYITTPAHISSSNHVLEGKVGAVIMPRERSVDIDTIEDLKFAEALMM